MTRFLLLSLMATILCRAAGLPWYMQETAMTEDGRLTFLAKPWWPKAKALKEGEHFVLDANHDGRPDIWIERRDDNIIEIIDDGGNSEDIAHNRANAAYVVSLKGTGLVDRMLVYIDNDGDGKADETELRHYQDGYLRYAWFSENRDRDGRDIFTLKNWSYVGGNDFRNKFRGNVDIFLNKYDPRASKWTPLSECPFTFWDLDGDGHSDVVLRVSAAPLASQQGKDLDYANHYQYMWSPNAVPLEEMGNMNVRFSYNLDPTPRREPEDKPHFTFGFNLVGSEPYSYPGMRYTNAKRRPPQTVVRIPSEGGVAVALHYPASQTGFTWDETRSVFRWEGQFWIYERRFMTNTGGPTARWNMRREYSAKPASQRKLYFSETDQRYHLFGASEGWLETGHLVNDNKDLEFRFYDSDNDGYFDTTQVFVGTNPVPARVSRIDKPKVRSVALDRVALRTEYNNHVLPAAIAADRHFIEISRAVRTVDLADRYVAKADRADSAERTRYCLDVARELYFLQVRDAFYESNAAVKDSVQAWSAALRLQQFIRAYENGELDKAASLIPDLARPL